jgi:hypothetical protein
MGEGEAEDGECDEAVFAVDRHSNSQGGFVLIRGCASTVGGFVGGGVFRFDAVPHGTLRRDKGGVMGVLCELVQLWVVPYGCTPRCARPSLHVGMDIE